MQTTKIKYSDAKAVIKAAYPGYRGRRVCLAVSDSPIDTTSGAYWSGGSRTYYTFVRLADLKVMEVPSQHPCFDRKINGAEAVTLPDGIVCVKHQYFGQHQSIQIVTRPENVARFLPVSV